MRFSRKRKDKRKEEALTGIGLAQPVARVQGDFRSKTTRFHRRSASYLMLDAALTRKASEQWRVSQRAIQPCQCSNWATAASHSAIVSAFAARSDGF